MPPFKVTLSTNKLGDLCTDGLTILVSKKFRNAWQQHALTGLEFAPEPVATNSAAGDQMEYRVVRVPSTVTYMDEAASGLEVEKVAGCDQCRTASRRKVERIRVDENSWNGFDAFRPSGLYGVTLVTEKFVQMVRDYELTNFHFIYQDDYFEPKIYDTP